MESETVRNAHRFSPAAPDEEYVFGACCPGWHSAAPSEEALDDWLSFMVDRDVERVCCLLPGRDLGRPDGNVGRYRRAFGDEAVCHAPLTARGLADVGVLRREILPFLEASRSARERVVVHCLDGIGPTGQTLAAWLAYDRGYDPERATETVREMGRLPDDPVRNGHATEEELHERLESVRSGSTAQ